MHNVAGPLPSTTRAREILLVEDSPGDVDLATLALEALGSASRLVVAADGVEALQYLRQEGRFQNVSRPDLVLLDLNLPRLSGHQVLAELRRDPALALIPVAIFTSSAIEQDVLQSYRSQANCYLQKPVGLSGYVALLRELQTFWFEVALLPPLTS